MVVLRPTKKLSGQLAMERSVMENSDTALGDWYVNRFVLDRKPLLLLVSSTSLLPILLPARDVRSVPVRLGAIVEARLARMGIEPSVIEAERTAMVPVRIAPTASRSVLGTVVDFAFLASNYLDPGEWTDETLAVVADRLAEAPCRVTGPSDRTIFPRDRAAELLRAKWGLR